MGDQVPECLRRAELVVSVHVAGGKYCRNPVDFSLRSGAVSSSSVQGVQYPELVGHVFVVVNTCSRPGVRFA